MSSLPREVIYSEIKRGKIFNAAIPHTFGRPLIFVEQDSSNPDTYKLIEKQDGFEGVIDPVTGKRTAPTVKAVAEFKLRPAVVIQSNNLNFNEAYPFVIVLPIASIYEEDLQDPEIKRMMSKNDIAHFHYTGKVTGRDAFVSITKPSRINKNLLYKPKQEIILEDSMMEGILLKLAKCFEIKKIEQCDNCHQNCAKCEYKVPVNE